MDEIEYLSRFPNCFESVSILENLIKVNPHLTFEIIKLAMLMGINAAENNIRIQYENLARVSPPNSVKLINIGIPNEY